MSNPSRDQLPIQRSSTADIRMNTWEYHDFIDALLDDKLTPAGLLKLKRLHEIMSINILATTIAVAPFAWVGNRWLQGFVNRGMASTRFNFFGMAIFYPLFLYWGFTRPIPRKIYTDLIADVGTDGQYIRESLRMYKPGLWTKISHQLHNLKFDFTQMHQHKGIQFPANFVNSRVI